MSFNFPISVNFVPTLVLKACQDVFKNSVSKLDQERLPLAVFTNPIKASSMKLTTPMFGVLLQTVFV